MSAAIERLKTELLRKSHDLTQRVWSRLKPCDRRIGDWQPTLCGQNNLFCSVTKPYQRCRIKIAFFYILGHTLLHATTTHFHSLNCPLFIVVISVVYNNIMQYLSRFRNSSVSFSSFIKINKEKISLINPIRINKWKVTNEYRYKNKLMQ